MTTTVPPATRARRGQEQIRAALGSPLLLATVALIVAAIAPHLVSGFRTFQFTIALCFIIALLGLNLLTGFGGIISVATAAFFGLGAYSVLILENEIAASQYEFSPIAYLGLPVGFVVAFAVGALLGLPVTRLRGWNLALLTIGVGVSFSPLIRRFKGVTGGSIGIQMAKPTAPAWTGLTDDQWIYYIGLACLAALFTVSWLIMRSTIGKALLAGKDNELAARALGVDISRFRIIVFALSAGFAGVGGAVFGLTTQTTDPEAFTVLLSITFLLGAILGGLGSVVGPVIGGFFLVYARLWAEGVFPGAILLVYGILLVTVMYIAPTGVADVPRRLARLGRRLRGPSTTNSASQSELPASAREGESVDG